MALMVFPQLYGHGLPTVCPRFHAARQTVYVLKTLALQEACRDISPVSDAAGNDNFLVFGDFERIIKQRCQRQMLCLPDMAG